MLRCFVMRKAIGSWDVNIFTVDGVHLLTLYALFSQFRPRDVLYGLCLLHIGTWMHVHKTKFEKTVLWGTITWSEMGKQNLQAKNVYRIRC